jgi:hypothetical protein
MRSATNEFLEQWKVALAFELERRFGWEPFEGSNYIAKTGDDCWREMYDDGLTPSDAAGEEVIAAHD